MMIRCLDWTGDRILAESVDRLRMRSGSWAVGVHGAIAEFVIGADEPAAIDVTGTVITAITARGALRVDVAGTAAFELVLTSRPTVRRAVILGTRRRAENVRHTVTTLGPDPAGLHPDAAGGLLVDMGIGFAACRFCVRTSDTALRAALHDCVPPPDGRSPDGPHTHLLHDALDRPHEFDGKHDLPAGWAPGAIWHSDPPADGH